MKKVKNVLFMFLLMTCSLGLILFNSQPVKAYPGFGGEKQIHLATHPDKVLTAAPDNSVVLSTNKNLPSQKWKIIYNDKTDRYSIYNVGNGKTLLFKHHDVGDRDLVLGNGGGWGSVWNIFYKYGGQVIQNHDPSEFYIRVFGNNFNPPDGTKLFMAYDEIPFRNLVTFIIK